MIRAVPFWLAIAAMVAVAAIATLSAPRARAADATPTAQQIAACYPDAARFCPAKIPEGSSAVKLCMLEHKAELSQACREAFHK